MHQVTLKEEGVVENVGWRRECARDKKEWPRGTERLEMKRQRRAMQTEREIACTSPWETLMIPSTNSCLKPIMRERRRRRRWTGGGGGPVQSNTLHHPEAMQCALSNFFKSHIKIYLHFLFSLGLQAALKFVWHKLSQRLWSHWSQNGANLPGWPLDLLP